jgi:glucosyl-3-phosphoglycerate phosphatase
MTISTNGKRIFIARHGETIFNVVARFQGMEAHTPLTWGGCKQAVRMGEALRRYINDPSALRLIASPSGRALQTLSLICEQISADWHAHETDNRMREIEIGNWEGQYYVDVFENVGDFLCAEHRLFKLFADDGENYEDIAVRLREWIKDQAFDSDMIVISHGMTARVLRGLLQGLPDFGDYQAPIADSVSQGSMVMICDGVEELVISGDGSGEKV